MMAPTQALYVLLATLSIGGSGRWDYITCDAKNDLLYVPRTTHVMVISPADGKLVADIDGLGETHGVALVPELNRGFVSDSAGDGSVTIFDLKSHAVLGRIAAADDADAIVYDRERGIYADPNKVHYANYQGKFVRTRGPLPTLRSTSRSCCGRSRRRPGPGPRRSLTSPLRRLNPLPWHAN